MADKPSATSRRRKRLSAKERVRRKFPEAYCSDRAPFLIHPRIYSRNEPALGVSYVSQEDAWKEAARNLKL